MNFLRMNKKQLLIVISPLFLYSCEQYVPNLLQPAATAEHFSKRSLDDSSVRSALISAGTRKSTKSWPPSTWTLGELQAAALHFHPDIVLAKAQAKSALAAITTADTSPNPSISFSPEIGANPGVGISPWVLGFSLDIPIETAGKKFERTREARAKANAAVLAISSKSWSVISLVRVKLLEWQGLTERVKILEQQRANDQQLVSLVAAKIAAGESARTEIIIFQSQQSRDMVDLSAARSKLDAARAALADAVGVSASSFRNVNVAFGELDHFPNLPSDSKMRKAALQLRADLLAALEDYSAADAALRLEIAKQTPDFHLNPGYTFDQGQSRWALGIGLTLPIDRNRGPIREAVAKRDEAAAAFNRLQIAVSGEFDQALAAYRAESSQISAVNHLYATQQKQLEDAQHMRQAGAADQVGELVAKSLLLQSQLSLLDALLERQQSLGHLQDSICISF